MNFASSSFLLFYVIVATVYWSIREKRSRKLLLLAASYYFYMSWNVRLISLILISTFLDYFAGLVMSRYEETRVRRAALAASVIGNLGLLGFFKYSNFFIDSFITFTDSLGLHTSVHTLNIILPVGISFYTFQTLSYTIDLYRERLKPCTNILDFALFVAFFPQLVAGPIVRASHFIPQMDLDHRWDWTRFRGGLYRMLVGLAKKIVIADMLAIVVDPVYGDPSIYGTTASWIAAVGFAVQLYCDMAAYTDIAIGAGMIFGYELPENFNHPFLAQSMNEFWRRCHMSLSTWLRDYLYIFALGGNRGTTARVYFNLMATMVLGGIWHGAGWTYVVWGFYVATLMCVERALERSGLLLRNWLKSGPWVWFRIVRTFLLHTLGLVIFRSQSFHDVFAMYQNLFGLRSPLVMTTIRTSVVWVMGIILVTHILAWIRESFDWDWTRPLVVRAAIATGCIVGIVTFARPNPDAFIYFQF